MFPPINIWLSTDILGPIGFVFSLLVKPDRAGCLPLIERLSHHNTYTYSSVHGGSATCV